MLNSYLTTLKKYTQFSGRATRSEYWTFVLGNIIAFILLGILGGILGSISDILSGLVGLVYIVFSLGVILPNIAVLVRRLHDTGRSGWWYFIVLVPLVGSIVLLVFLLSESQEGKNEYDLEPKNSEATIEV